MVISIKHTKQTIMKKRTFTTSDIALICDHSSETIKRWLEKGEIKGYRVGAHGHWRVLAEDLALFLKNNNIPFPAPEEIGMDLKSLKGIGNQPTFCWEFYKNRMNEHLRSDAQCEDCLVYKVRSTNCYALRKEVEHKKIHCGISCDDCAYFHFQQKVIEPET
jgi:excisionase family DNA binding protein